jgi:hypothetical protein
VVLDDYERPKGAAAAEKTLQDLEKYERGETRGWDHISPAQCYLALNDESKVFQYLESALKANPARYARIEKDVVDERNLLYTLKDDPLLKKTMAKALYECRAPHRRIRVVVLRFSISEAPLGESRLRTCQKAA